MFLSIDGGDGCGKSTQMTLLADWLRESGREVFTCRDPGSTKLGESIRGILLHRHDMRISRESEMLLFMAARAQMMQEMILPALEKGQIVITDRFLLSTIVYQGYAGGLSIEAIEQVGQIATAGRLPDMTFVLDISFEEAEKRMDSREKDRMELMGESFHRQVREGFLKHAATDPKRYVVLDATWPKEVIAKKIRERLSSFL